MRSSIKRLSLILVVFLLFGSVLAVQQTAKCASNFVNVDIISKTDYGIGESIDNIQLSVLSNIGSNLDYIAELVPATLNSTNVAKVVGRMSGGNATFSFKYTPNAVGNYFIKVTIGSGDTAIVESKQIFIKNAFSLRLTCPPNIYINQPITCTWEPKDKVSLTAVSLSSVPIVTVTQGDVILPSPIVGSTVTFQTQNAGSVKIIATGNAVGYVTSTETINPIVSDLKDTPVFQIDSKDYALYVDSGITTGSHNLRIQIKEGNTVASINRIAATITTPTGQVTDVTFIKSGDYWQSTYNFPSAGQKYILKGTVQYTDKPTDTSLVYDIITLASGGQDDTLLITYIIIGSSVFLIVLVGLILYFNKRKKK
jgi:hypothetical protein